MQAFSIYRMSTAESRNADGIIVVYDANSEASLQEATQWLSEAGRYDDKTRSMYFVSFSLSVSV